MVIISIIIVIVIFVGPLLVGYICNPCCKKHAYGSDDITGVDDFGHGDCDHD